MTPEIQTQTQTESAQNQTNAGIGGGEGYNLELPGGATVRLLRSERGVVAPPEIIEGEATPGGKEVIVEASDGERRLSSTELLLGNRLYRGGTEFQLYTPDRFEEAFAAKTAVHGDTEEGPPADLPEATHAPINGGM